MSLGELWPQTGLVGLWHMNGNSTDSSGSGYNGTDTAITYSQANGKFGQGAGFNGSSSYITMGNVLAFERTNPFTIKATFKTNSLATFQDVIAKTLNASPYRGYALDIENTTGKLIFEIVNTETNFAQIKTNSGISTGVWYHVVAVNSGVGDHTGLSIYVNGAPVPFTVTANTLTSTIVSTYPLNFGARNNVANFFNGSLDEFSIYNVAKDAAWVRKQYALRVGKFY